MTGWNPNIAAFVLMTILVVGLAGVYPHLVIGILVIVLAGIVLSNKYYPGIVSLINTLFPGGHPA